MTRTSAPPDQMTPAKVLSKSQMKKAARKSQVRTRNVLMNPFPVRWPAVPRAAAAAVQTALTGSLPQFSIVTALRQSEYVALLADGGRPAVCAARAALRAAAAPHLETRRQLLRDVTLGFNAASRALEAGRLTALLVELDTPALETCLLAPLAVGRRCAAVCVPRLRAALQVRLGIASTVMGLERAVEDPTHRLHSLWKAVCAAAAAATGGEPKSGAAHAGDSSDARTADDSEAQAASCQPTQRPEGSSSSSSSSEQEEEEQQQQQQDREVACPPSPVPFDQADFIRFSGPVKQLNRRSVGDQLDAVMFLDTVGVPHRRRLQLKRERVVTVTLGDKAAKRAARHRQRAVGEKGGTGDLAAAGKKGGETGAD